MMQFLSITDWILFACLAISIVYLFVFAIASLSKGKAHYPPSVKKHNIVVLFAAYKEDQVIVNSVKKFLNQNYPKNNVDIIVISDQMQEQTNNELRQLPITLLETPCEMGSKANALSYAIDSLGDKIYDILVIMDADNLAETNFLQKINDTYSSGIKAIQAHRAAKNMNTDTAILDAASEEINNSFFRKGHTNLGLSSALSGSGMAFDFEWFRTNVKKLSSSGEDKELERLLLQQRIYTEYLNDVYIYDEKTQNSSNFYNQRRRWLASQLGIMKSSIKDLPHAIASHNFDYCNKIIQWMMLPRVLLLGATALLTIIFTCINIEWAMKWWGLSLLLALTFLIAIPKELINKRFVKALLKVPVLFGLMFLNLFRLKGANKKFEHTEHTH